MDRVTQRRKKGNRLIGQRYLLQTTVVSNSAGTLYQARDMRAGAAQDAQVIIHVLPPNALRSIPLKLLTERIQALSQQADSSVLKLLDSGWTNTEPYFVLASPATWSVSALPAMLGQSTRLHQQALQLNQRLTEQGLIKGALPTSLFLVSADGQVYLPSTALVLSLHNLVESPDLLLQAHRLPKHTRFKALPFLGLGFIGVVAASGAGFYYQNYLANSQALLEESTRAARTTSLLEPATLNELPVVQSPTLNSSSLADTPSLKSEPEKFDDNRVLTNSRSSSAQPIHEQAQSLATTPQLNNAVTSTQILPDPEPGDMRVALAGEQAKSPMTPETQQPPSTSAIPMPDKQTQPTITKTHAPKAEAKLEKKPVPRFEPPAEFVEETDPTVNLPSPQPQLIRGNVDTQLPRAQFASSTPNPNAVAVVPAPQPVTIIQSAPMLGAVNPVVAAPVARIQVPTRDPEVLTTNGMTSDELVKKAYQALQSNQLDEQANRGAIYFVRLLDKIDHGNPQVLRLARETSYQLHQQVRTALIQGDSEQASQKLWRAGRIIKEFNLVQLNPAQEILEHKLAE